MLLAAVAAVVALLLAGCTSGPTPAGAAPAQVSSATPDPVLSATVRTPASAAEVVGGATPGALSRAVSQALFATAPVVIAAASADRAGIAAAGRQATLLGAPLLLIDPPPAPARPSPEAIASPTTRPRLPTDGAALHTEIDRLHAQAVLAVGAVAADALRQVIGGRVVTDPSLLPHLTAPPPVPGLTVLVEAGGGPATRAGATAATATAHAAGARVVLVHGLDPRADPAAIRALAAQHPRHVLAAGAGFGPADRLAARLAVAATGTQLPGGGQVLFPGRRFVALYGVPGAPALGVLGEQGLTASIARAKRLAASYDPLSAVPVIPALEIIATVAQGSPGGDGDYSNEASVAALRPWVEQAGRAGLYVVLDLQPGRADFLGQAKRYAPLLALPYVGLALDPEWRLAPHQLPLRQIGGVDIGEVNRVITWLAALTAQHHLPQKLVVLHQFKLSMLRGEAALDTSHDDLAVLIHMDGQGGTAVKDNTWHAVLRAAPPHVWFGWKNFYDEDHPMLTPAQTMSRRPQPLMISYQ